MKLNFICSIVFAFAFAGHCFSQCSFPANEDKGKRVRRTIAPYVTVDIPKEFKLTDTGGNIDYWYGKIVSSDEKFRISFSAGMVRSFFEDFEKKIVCKEVAKADELPVAFAVAKDSNREIVLATVFWAQFQATVTSPQEKAVFYEIVRSFRKKL